MPEQVQTNLKILQRSRKAPQPGDLFVMQLPDELYTFGRVISTAAMVGPAMPGAILIYVYSHRSRSKDPPSDLSPDQLLVPPMMTNRLPWSRGYFETIGHASLTAHDILRQHCFRDHVRDRYFDESGNELADPTEPVGDYGLHSFRTIDDAISKALGFELAPD